jgi:hypothetical protein
MTTEDRRRLAILSNDVLPVFEHLHCDRVRVRVRVRVKVKVGVRVGSWSWNRSRSRFRVRTTEQRSKIIMKTQSKNAGHVRNKD